MLQAFCLLPFGLEMAGPYVFCWRSIYDHIYSMILLAASSQRFSCTCCIQNGLMQCIVLLLTWSTILHAFSACWNANVILSMQVYLHLVRYRHKIWYKSFIICVSQRFSFDALQFVSHSQENCSQLGNHHAVPWGHMFHWWPCYSHKEWQLELYVPPTMAAPKQTHSTAIVPDVSKNSLVTRPGSWFYGCFHVLRWKLGARVLKIWWSVYLSHRMDLHTPGWPRPQRGLGLSSIKQMLNGTLPMLVPSHKGTKSTM